MGKLISMIVSLVIILAVAFAGYEAYLKKPPASALSEPVVIANGMSASEIAAVLKKAGIISSAPIFTVLAEATGRFKDFHAGTFILKEGMSAFDALKTLSIKGQNEITVTIPEGYNLRDIAKRLTDLGVIASADAFYAVTGEPAKLTKTASGLTKDRPFLSELPDNVSLEGYLFPDTYRFYAGTAPEVVAGRMLDAYETKVATLPSKIDPATLTVASLLEKEVNDPADRAKVADIIERRLKAGMPLQLDSTVNYATGKSLPAVTSDDLNVNSPYNTYKNKGLPPGPICGPGLDSIKAALTPTPNKYWYFLTTSDGKVIYSITLSEHNAAKAKYLK